MSESKTTESIDDRIEDDRDDRVDCAWVVDDYRRWPRR